MAGASQTPPVTKTKGALGIRETGLRKSHHDGS